ncbi:siphovirus ReqiPepy6 Gp37-like family protein, partial [Virgibacillus salexigens]|uniref:siphovirus ReqiPepy6 Gp37-like family protein n=1 Tax=Virgibacillus salexigens TaxID=61016 RepID=UPI003081BC7B
MKVPIRIYNRFLDFEGEIDTYQSMQFGRSFHSIADFELHVNRYMHEAKKLTKGDIIGLGKQANKAAIILTKEIALDENGKEAENFKLTGCTLDGLTIRRITVPPSHTAYDRKSGNAETVMKHYMMNHFVNPVDPDRKMPHIEVAPNQKRGPYIEWESRFKNVAEELENISIKSGLGWGIFANFKTKKLIFDVIEAKDLTQGNPYGYDPVFFSPEFDTIKSQSFVDSDNDLKTVGYVGGQGEGIDRQIITVGSKTGWDRIETFIDARDVGDSEDEELSPEEIEQQLIERGQSKMSEMETFRSLEAEIKTPVKDVTPFQYEKHYDLGDKVQVVNKSWGLTMEAPITEFNEIHESAGFRLEATFGRSRPTLISKIKDKFNELDGIEKQELPAQIAVETRKYTDQEVYREEQERIEQSKENLQTSKDYTEGWSEKGATVGAPAGTPVNDRVAEEVDADAKAGKEAKTVVDTNKGNWDRALFFNEDGTLNVENLKGLLTDDQLESAARWNGRTTKIGDDGIYTGTVIAEQLIAGILNTDKVEIKGANGGVTINAKGVNAKNAAFTLEDDESSMPYNVTPQRNIVKDHSFELVIPDYGSMGSGSVNYNWLEMVLSEVPIENFWTKSGSPKVAVVLGPSDRSALPIFGEQAIVVRDANFVRQILWDGIAAGMTFTATGYFKRQHNVVGGGTPRFEIDHLDAGGNFKARLTNTIFP